MCIGLHGSLGTAGILICTPSLLDLGVPDPYGNKGEMQTDAPWRRSLQFAWLAKELIADPGDFGRIAEQRSGRPAIGVVRQTTGYTLTIF